MHTPLRRALVLLFGVSTALAQEAPPEEERDGGGGWLARVLSPWASPLKVTTA